MAGDVMVQIVRGAMIWRSGLQVDADGSPHAYHPDSKPGLDFLANAGSPRKWWGLACADDGTPYVQGPDDPAPGFYVSTTSLYDARYLAKDPRRYVDSETVRYITATRDMVQRGCRMGDSAVALRGGKLVACVVADVGPRPGEGSIALCQALGVPSDPRHGGTDVPEICFAVFPGSSRGAPWPRNFAVDAFARLESWGGSTALEAALAA